MFSKALSHLCCGVWDGCHDVHDEYVMTIRDYRIAQSKFVAAKVALQRSKRREETNPEKYLVQFEKSSQEFVKAEKEYDDQIREFDSKNFNLREK